MLVDTRRKPHNNIADGHQSQNYQLPLDLTIQWYWLLKRKTKTYLLRSYDTIYYRVHLYRFLLSYDYVVVVVIRSRNLSIRSFFANVFSTFVHGRVTTDAAFILLKFFSHHTYNIIIIIYAHACVLYTIYFLHAFVIIIIIFQWRFESIYSVFENTSRGL